ncbi:MAG: hypothetical protein Q8L95_11935 [Burkholderiales bacterium]|nr:hypothetical protein [Burkholderiales bacterium]
MKRALIAGVAACLITVAGCGEQSQVTVYKQGQYQGKPDARPWDNAQFKNDRAAWEKAIKARNSGQDEYARASN